MPTPDPIPPVSGTGNRKRARPKWLVWVTRLGAVSSALLVVGVVVGWLLVRSDPGWYRVESNPEQVNVSANRFEDRLVELVNWSAAVGAAELRGSRVPRSGVVSTGPAREWEIRFRADEMTAFVRRWAVVNGWDREIGRFWRDPAVAVEGGRVILGGRPGGDASASAGAVGIGDAVLGLHLRPEFDPSSGKLSLTLERITFGRLPVPTRLLATPLAQGADRVQAELDRWRRDARLDDRGRSNTAMTRASAAVILEAILRQEPVDAVGFVPMDERRGLAVEVVGLTVVDGKGQPGFGEVVVKLAAVPAERRAALGDRVRGK